MNYQDILKEVGGAELGSSPRNSNGFGGQGKLATRKSPHGPDENPNHHLWNNRGTWWCHFTLHRPDYTSERIRVSLKTSDIDEARIRRDELLHAFR